MRRLRASSAPAARGSPSVSGAGADTAGYWEAHVGQYLRFYANACR
jgi:hypothetical protein